MNASLPTVEAPAAAVPGSVPEVEVRRSARRKRTVSAAWEGEKIVVSLPARMSKREEATWVSTMVARLQAKKTRKASTDEDLAARATALSKKYLESRAKPTSITWSTRQNTRWGSCGPSEGTIRISTQLREMPRWVQDYVIVHELCHLLRNGHDEMFWAYVNRYPETERAKAFLEGVSYAARLGIYRDGAQ